MGRSLNYRPNNTIKSKQTFVASENAAQNDYLQITISAVVQAKSKLIASNNPYGASAIYGRMWYWNSNTTIRGITRNSNGGSASGYLRYSVDVVEYY